MFFRQCSHFLGEWSRAFLQEHSLTKLTPENSSVRTVVNIIR